MNIFEKLDWEKYQEKINAANFEIGVLTAVISSQREQLAAFMLRNSFATGHGDTFADLLGELEWQVKERAVRRSEGMEPI